MARGTLAGFCLKEAFMSGNFWDVVWWFLFAFFFIAYLFVLFAIISDLFRDHKLNGWLKALWIIFLIFLPFLTALVYLIARGRGMTERSQAEAQRYQAAQAEYIKSVAGSGGGGASPADEIAKAKALLDPRISRRALRSPPSPPRPPRGGGAGPLPCVRGRRAGSPRPPR